MNKRYEPTQEIADLIIEKYNTGISGNSLAHEFHVSKPTMYSFLRRNNVEISKDAESKYLRYGLPTEVVVLPKVDDYYVTCIKVQRMILYFMQVKVEGRDIRL